MNYTITNPKGIDKEIQNSQNDLFKYLDWGSLDVYGRIRKNPTQEGFVPEAYIGGNEYRDLYMNDEVNATICFIEDEDHSYDDFTKYWSADVKCVIMVNLSKILPSITHRADSEAQIAVIKQLEKNSMFTVSGLEKGLPNIFQGFYIEKITTDDMQPFHIFAVTGTMKYKIHC